MDGNPANFWILWIQFTNMITIYSRMYRHVTGISYAHPLVLTNIPCCAALPTSAVTKFGSTFPCVTWEYTRFEFLDLL